MVDLFSRKPIAPKSLFQNILSKKDKQLFKTLVYNSQKLYHFQLRLFFFFFELELKHLRSYFLEN